MIGALLYIQPIIAIHSNSMMACSGDGPLWHTAVQPPTALSSVIGIDTNIIYLLTYAKLAKETTVNSVTRQQYLMRLTEAGMSYEQFITFKHYCCLLEDKLKEVVLITGATARAEFYNEAVSLPFIVILLR